MSNLCPECAAAMPEGVEACPSCGAGLRDVEVEKARGKVGWLPVRLAGALGYFILPAGIFLLLEPYRSDRFTRFHAWQGLGWFGAGLGAAVLLWLVGGVMGLIPVLALMFLSTLVGLGFGVAWLALVVKALQGEMWRLPGVGAVAERQAELG